MTADAARPGSASAGTPGLVSVLVNCYNSERYLHEAIASVVAQTYPHWELLFWDNQSTDGSAAIAQSFGDARIRYLRAPEHTTLGKARELAVREARGEFLAILDCDDVWYPEKLERQMALAQRMPEAGVLFSGYDIISSTGELRAQATRRAAARSGEVFEALLRQQFTVCWPTVVFRTTALREAGPFAPLKYVEDLEILLRIAARWPYGYDETRLAAYRVHSTQLSTNFVAMREEVLGICDDWATQWRAIGALTRDQERLLARARSRAWAISARHAMANGAPATALFRTALSHAVTAEAAFGFAVSLLGSARAVRIIAGVRRVLGYGNI